MYKSIYYSVDRVNFNFSNLITNVGDERNFVKITEVINEFRYFYDVKIDQRYTFTKSIENGFEFSLITNMSVSLFEDENNLFLFVMHP